MLRRLLNRLHRIFDKEPHSVTGITISSPVALAITVQDFVVTVTASGYATATFTGTDTLTDLGDWLTATFGATVAVNPLLVSRKWDIALEMFEETPTAMCACWLQEGTYSGQELALPYPESLLYHEMQVYARLLTEQSARLQEACEQVYMLKADGAWLDYWCRDYFGILRYTGESDSDYRQRVVHELLRPVANNKAMEAIVLETLGVRCKITDAQPVTSNADDAGRFFVDVTLDNSLSEAEKTALIDKAYNIVNRYKAAGTAIVAKYTDNNLMTEFVTVGEIYELLAGLTLEEAAYAPGKLMAGAGWRAGTPGLKAGTNNALLEQVHVRTIRVADDVVEASALYGG